MVKVYWGKKVINARSDYAKVSQSSKDLIRLYFGGKNIYMTQVFKCTSKILLLAWQSALHRKWINELITYMRNKKNKTMRIDMYNGRKWVAIHVNFNLKWINVRLNKLPSPKYCAFPRIAQREIFSPHSPPKNHKLTLRCNS